MVFDDNARKRFVQSNSAYFKRHPEEQRKFEYNSKVASAIMLPLLVVSIFGWKFFYSKTGIHPLFILVPLMVIIIIITVTMKRRLAKKLKS